MAVISGISEQGVFLLFSKKIFQRVKTVRGMCYVLILLCFFTSMWITNDVAIITFVPFAVLMLKQSGQEKYMIYIIIMQTIAANLGSMLTPIGNPQNLYLYTYYHLSEVVFLVVTIPIVLASFIIITLINLLIKKEPLQILVGNEDYSHDQKKLRAADINSFPGNAIHTVVYAILFLLCLGAVLLLIDYRLVLVIIILVIGLMDRKIFKNVDYTLLLTFICFFIFSGNLGNIPAIHQFISNLITSREMIIAILLSQVISNVPAAILLSNFTEQGKSLIVGANLGGLGTIIASLASLISLKIYLKTEHANSIKFLLFFTIANVGMLTILILFHYLIVLI